MKTKNSPIPIPSPKGKGTVARDLTPQYFLMKIILGVVFIFSIQLSSAQNNTQDVVYLKDGSIYRGAINSTAKDGTIKLLTYGNNVVVIQPSRIDSVTKEKMKPRNTFPQYTKGKGYFNQTGFGLSVSEMSSGVRFETINGYRWNHFLEAGAALALDYSDVAFVPLYATVRSDLMKTRATPLLFAGCGYNFYAGSRSYYYFSEDNYNTNHGGLFANAGTGFKVNTRGDVSYLFTFSYNMFKWSRDYNWADNHTHYDYTYNRIALNFALEF